MGVLSEGINGPVSGKVGGVVFYRVGNQTRARSLPFRSKKKRKPTPLQARQRTRFAAMQEWLRPIKRIIRFGFRDGDSPRSAHNAAMSYNLNHAMTEEPGGVFTVNPEAFRFSKGLLTPPINPVATQEDDRVRFMWDKPGARDLPSGTRTMLLLHIPTANTGYYEVYGAYANTTEDTIDLHGLRHLNEEPCHAYIAFIEEETGQVSDSVHAGSFLIEKG